MLSSPSLLTSNVRQARSGTAFIRPGTMCGDSRPVPAPSRSAAPSIGKRLYPTMPFISVQPGARLAATHASKADDDAGTPSIQVIHAVNHPVTVLHI